MLFICRGGKGGWVGGDSFKWVFSSSCSTLQCKFVLLPHLPAQFLQEQWDVESIVVEVCTQLLQRLLGFYLDYFCSVMELFKKKIIVHFVEERFVNMYLCPWFSEEEPVAPDLRDLSSLGQSRGAYSSGSPGCSLPFPDFVSGVSHFFCASHWPQQVRSCNPTTEKVREC